MAFKLYNEIIQTTMLIHWGINAKATITWHTALERYKCFLENYLGFIDQVSNKRIAS